jgi:hypothetical protein
MAPGEFGLGRKVARWEAAQATQSDSAFPQLRRQGKPEVAIGMVPPDLRGFALNEHVQLDVVQNLTDHAIDTDNLRAPVKKFCTNMGAPWVS